MRIAITNPYAWPHVRRGSERLLDNLARHLASRGHSVTVHAMAPVAGVEGRDGVEYRFLRQRGFVAPRQFNQLHGFAFHLQAALGRSNAQVVFCLNYFDAYAAIRARAHFRKNYKVVFMSVGIPTRAYFRAVPLDAWFMRKVLRQSDQLLVLSQFARDCLQRDWGVNAAVLPPPVETTRFAAHSVERTALAPLLPRILFVGDVDEGRKGATLLCRAFAQVRQSHPEATLVFAGRASEARRIALLETVADRSVRDSIQFAGLGQIDELPGLFQSASVTVLPAVWEAFGLVLVESLAAGTPVVGARHGGIPDIIDSSLVGECFDPSPFDRESHNVEGLVAALLSVLARGKTEAVRVACQARAEYFSWASLGAEYEQWLQAVVARPESRKA
ncbi:MAG: glycosyltransferase family 4 protein [Luteimonas sp.]